MENVTSSNLRILHRELHALQKAEEYIQTKVFTGKKKNWKQSDGLCVYEIKYFGEHGDLIS